MVKEFFFFYYSNRDINALRNNGGKVFNLKNGYLVSSYF